MKCIALVLGAAMTCGIVRPADAQSSPQGQEITIAISSCSELPWAGLTWAELVRVELSATGQFARIRIDDSAGPLGPSAWRVAVELRDCRADADVATLKIEAPARTTARIVDLTQVAAVARSRVLALAAAEMVRSECLAESASRNNTTQEAPVSALPGATPSDVQMTTSDAAAPLEHLHGDPVLTGLDQRGPLRRTERHFFAAGEMRDFLSGRAELWGARAGALFPLKSPLVVQTDAGASFGRARDPLGTVNSLLATAGIGLVATAGVKRTTLGLGVRLELGAASFNAAPDAPATVAHQVTSPVVLVATTAMAFVPVIGPFSGFAALDFGTSLYGFSPLADDRVVSSVRGLLLSARLGLGWDAGAGR